MKDMITADDPDSDLCTIGGKVDHDYRSYVAAPPSGLVLRCVWCHVVACGSAQDDDPCIEPYHHTVPHRTKTGIYWPIGGTRPSPRNRPR